MDAIAFFLSRYNDLHGGLVDGQPSWIHRRSPRDIVERRLGQLRFRLSAGILDLNVEDDI